MQKKNRQLWTSDRQRRWLAVPLIASIAGLVACLAAASTVEAQKPRNPRAKVEKPEKPKLRRGWNEMRTPNFVLFGDASERQMQTVATSLESLRAFLDQMAKEEVRAPVPTFIYVFRNRKSYTPYEPRDFHGKPRDLAGFFINASHANYLVIDGSRREELGRIAQHEYTHFFASYRLPPIPLWFNEGLAEFYQSFEAKKDHVNIGKIHPHHLEWLQSRPLIPLLDLFAVHHLSPEYNEASRTSGFYAQSWALVHYLFLEAEGGRGQLARFLALQSRIPIETAFEQAFGMSTADMESQLRKYVRSRRFTYRRSELPAAAVDLDLSLRPIPESEALARLGELLAIQGIFRFKAADTHLRTALELNPEEVRGHVGLGLGQLQASTWGDAEAMTIHFAEARRLAPSDPSISYLHTLARAKKGDAPASLRGEAAALAEVHPRFLGAWRLLAWSWAGETEKISDATSVFEWVHRLIPDERSYAEHLHKLYRLAGRDADADSLVADYFVPLDREPPEEPGALPLP